MQEAFASRAPRPLADAAVAALDALLADGGTVPHRPAPHERGFALECGGWPLHVGARAVGGLLAVQAEVAPPGAVAPAWLLHRNRRDLRLVRYGSSSAGATWVHGELPLAAVPGSVDELLGRLVAAAEAARAVAAWPA